MEKLETINWSDFTKLEMRIGTIIFAKYFEEARNPSYRMEIDFGKFGIKKTSAQITKNYDPDNLIGRQIVAVVNFPPKQIANMMSECLVLGAVEDKTSVVLLSPDMKVENGTRIG